MIFKLLFTKACPSIDEYVHIGVDRNMAAAASASYLKIASSDGASEVRGH